MSLQEDIKNDGLFSQIVQRISDAEEFIRNHQSVSHKITPSSGWIPLECTLSFVSADSPSYVVSANDDLTGIISVGMRLWVIHGGTSKYFRVSAVGTYLSGTTLLTLYGGSAYSLSSSSSITLPFYSSMSSPFGFPSSPSLWSETLINSSVASQATPTAATWYNLGSLGLTLPIGLWDVYYTVVIELSVTLAAVTGVGTRVTLSTSSNSESDPELTSTFSSSLPIGANNLFRTTNQQRKTITTPSKTIYYLNELTGATGANSLSINPGSVFRTIISARFAYP